MNELIYFDNAATTKLSKPAYDAMLPFLEDGYGNPSSIYSIGRDAKKAIENARGRIDPSPIIGCDLRCSSCGE